MREADAHIDIANLNLRGYLPRPALRVAEHRVERAAHPAVDAHNHLGRWLSEDEGWETTDVPRLLADMDAANLRAIVNLDGRWGDELVANLERHDRRYCGRISGSASRTSAASCSCPTTSG
jgi:hypothetical protein